MWRPISATIFGHRAEEGGEKETGRGGEGETGRRLVRGWASAVSSAERRFAQNGNVVLSLRERVSSRGARRLQIANPRKGTQGDTFAWGRRREFCVAFAQGHGVQAEHVGIFGDARSVSASGAAG